MDSAPTSAACAVRAQHDNWSSPWKTTPKSPAMLILGAVSTPRVSALADASSTETARCVSKTYSTTPAPILAPTSSTNSTPTPLPMAFTSSGQRPCILGSNLLYRTTVLLLFTLSTTSVFRLYMRTSTRFGTLSNRMLTTTPSSTHFATLSSGLPVCVPNLSATLTTTILLFFFLTGSTLLRLLLLHPLLQSNLQTLLLLLLWILITLPLLLLLHLQPKPPTLLPSNFLTSPTTSCDLLVVSVYCHLCTKNKVKKKKRKSTLTPVTLTEILTRGLNPTLLPPYHRGFLILQRVWGLQLRTQLQ
uniref:Uncharacterized protein n=1 Tax=Lygus hesperus TaxID=30085 RepID=A0A146LTU4_LYGHE